MISPRNFLDAALPPEFWAKATPCPMSGCWLWFGATMSKGYGNLKRAGRWWRAHRFAYTLLVGAVPAELDLDHRCRVRSCVNPSHLEPVTRRVNLLRGETITAREAATTHCPRGHEYTPENTRSRRGKRECRTCERQRNRERRSRQSVLRQAP